MVVSGVELMACGPDLKRSVADPYCYHEVKDRKHFYLLVHVGDYACVRSDTVYVEARLAHVCDDANTDSHLDVK